MHEHLLKPYKGLTPNQEDYERDYKAYMYGKSMFPPKYINAVKEAKAYKAMKRVI